MGLDLGLDWSSVWVLFGFYVVSSWVPVGYDLGFYVRPTSVLFVFVAGPMCVLFGLYLGSTLASSWVLFGF